MLKKRGRSNQKDHLTSDAILESYSQSDVFAQKQKLNSFFNVPGLFVGCNPKGSESDSVRSPTSTLDFRVFSNFGNPFRSPRSSNEGHQKSWDCKKVGLSIIGSLDGESNQTGKLLRSSDSKNIQFGSNFRGNVDSFQAPKSLPKTMSIFPFTKTKPSNLQNGNSDVVFEIGEASSEKELVGNIRSYSLDSGKSGSHMIRFGSRSSIMMSRKPIISPSQPIGGSFEVGGSSRTDGCGTGLLDQLSASEIELSEDYTCVRKHGPNPKITHIFGDTVLECHGNELTNYSKDNGDLPQPTDCSEVLNTYPRDDFLSLCYSCKKKLDGEDIYMYRGEKAFCSSDCRSQEILIDEEMENADDDSSESNSHELPFKTGLFTVT